MSEARYSYAADILNADAKGYDRGVADVLALVEELALHFRDYPATTVANAMACVRPNVLRGKHVGLSLPLVQEAPAFDADRAGAFNAKLAAISAKAKDLLANLEAPKDHVINLSGLFGLSVALPSAGYTQIRTVGEIQRTPAGPTPLALEDQSPPLALEDQSQRRARLGLDIDEATLLTRAYDVLKQNGMDPAVVMARAGAAVDTFCRGACACTPR